VIGKLKVEPEVTAGKVKPPSDPNFVSYNPGFKLPATFVDADTCLDGNIGHRALTVITAFTKELPRSTVVPVAVTLTNCALLVEKARKFANASRDEY